jgi:hypothetical protein
MTAGATIEEPQIRRFVNLLFRHADAGTFVSLRSFYDTRNGVFAVEAVPLTEGRHLLEERAIAAAVAAEVAATPVVFCPPIATFTNKHHAREQDLANGLALSVECDAKPAEVRRKLEDILGPATVVVASGGVWRDDPTGIPQDKLHLHWRLTEPTRDAAGHAKLKLARRIAVKLTGADASNVPLVHPIRWPGSVHRKAAPRTAQIIAEADTELQLDSALEKLKNALGGGTRAHSNRPLQSRANPKQTKRNGARKATTRGAAMPRARSLKAKPAAPMRLSC